MHNATASADLRSALTSYKAAIGAAVANGALPRGLGLSVTVEQTPGILFPVAQVSILSCPLLVICPDRARARKPAAVLNEAGVSLRKALQAIASDQLAMLGSVSFDKSLLETQMECVRGQSAGAQYGPGNSIPAQVMAMLPAVSDPHAASPGRDFAAASNLLAEKLSARMVQGAFTSSADLYVFADEAFGGTQAHRLDTTARP